MLTPFAEFVQTSDYQADGFELSVDLEGTPINAKKMVLPSSLEAIKFFLHHDILLYETAARRDVAAVAVANQLRDSGASSAFVCRLDNVSNSDTVCYPYALYTVVGGLDPQVRTQIELDLQSEHETEDLESISPTLVQEDFSRRVLEHTACQCDSYEIGYPDKLAAILRTGWVCIEIIRRGRMTSTAAVSDIELLGYLQGLDGTNTVIYERVATPHVPRSWSEFLCAATKSLSGNSAWTRDFELFTRLIETSHPRAQISARIYNPLQTPLSLSKLALEGDPTYLPAIEVISNEDGSDTAILVGFLVWNGREPATSVDHMLSGIVDSTLEYSVRQHFGDTWQIDEAITQRLGLEYQSFILKPKPGGIYETFTLLNSDGGVSLTKCVPIAQESLVLFVRKYLELIKVISKELVPVSIG